jgi:hypothetical protein
VSTTIALLQELFGALIVERGLWPPRSPDLTPANIFRKSLVKATNLEELKHHAEQHWPETFCTVIGWMIVFKKVVAFSASAVKLFCKLFLKKKKARLSCSIDVTNA